MNRTAVTGSNTEQPRAVGVPGGGSVSHGPDQPRTAPSSPPHRLHFRTTARNFPAAPLDSRPDRSLTGRSPPSAGTRHTYRRSAAELPNTFRHFSLAFALFSSTSSAVTECRSFRTFLHRHARTPLDVITSPRAARREEITTKSKSSDQTSGRRLWLRVIT